MTDYDNTNRGVLFKNDKEGNEARPDYTGKIDIDGKEMRLAAWIKQSKDGTKKFLSLNVSEFPTKQVKNTCTVTEPDFDDEIPF